MSRCLAGKRRINSPEDIIIIKKSKMINGKIAVLYIYKDQMDLKRIMIVDEVGDLYEQEFEGLRR